MTLGYKISTKSETGEWKEFIRYETKEECINYLEKVNTELRPALIICGESLIRAYDHGIIDYEMIAQIEQENEDLRNGLFEVVRKSTPLSQSNKSEVNES